MLDSVVSEIDQVFFFGPFSLSPKKRLLLEDGKQVRLGCRAIEMLIVLVESAGELVSKEKLIGRVWPNTIVVEGNLTAQMTALRHALHDGRGGNRYILNEHGRGYRFIAPVMTAEEWELGLPAPQAPATIDQPSPSLMRLVELCYGLIDPSRERLPPPKDRAMLDAILQRGILALEFARMLVSAPDHAEAGGSKKAGSGIGIACASRWVETARAAASH